ncbi:hypothetical protein C8J57DRAFT_1718215 [Mycena rebaudengoi]|nr:hypothetical protein C8J57DRAFT_1718215 [Mycena rebaudengoi]
MFSKLLPTTVFAILALVMVQVAVAVPQIGLPVPCGGATVRIIGDILIQRSSHCT